MLWTVLLEKILENPLTTRRSRQSILKEVNPDYSLEGLMLKLKLQYIGPLMQRTAAAPAKSLQSCPTLCDPMTAARQAITNSQNLFKFMSIKSLMPSNHLILCCPLLLPPSIFPSIRVFSVSQFFTSVGQSIVVSASASVLPMNIQDWFPLGLTGLIVW